MARTPGEIDRWITEHDREHESLERRLKGEVRQEFNEAMTAAIRHVDELGRKVERMAIANDAQTTAIHEVKQETFEQTKIIKKVDAEIVRRAAIDDERDRVKKQATDDKEIAEKVRSSRNARLAVWIPVLLAIAGIVSAIVAAIASHK